LLWPSLLGLLLGYLACTTNAERDVAARAFEPMELKETSATVITYELGRHERHFVIARAPKVHVIFSF
jgi:hypothetical protein